MEGMTEGDQQGLLVYHLMIGSTSLNNQRHFAGLTDEQNGA